jgi:hypothetical protein
MANQGHELTCTVWLLVVSDISLEIMTLCVANIFVPIFHKAVSASFACNLNHYHVDDVYCPMAVY